MVFSGCLRYSGNGLVMSAPGRVKSLMSATLPVPSQFPMEFDTDLRQKCRTITNRTVTGMETMIVVVVKWVN